MANQKTPEYGKRLLDATDAIQIINNERYEQSDISGSLYVPATKWYVVDESRAEPDVNYPGDLISEHDSTADAKFGRAMAILERLYPGVTG